MQRQFGSVRQALRRANPLNSPAKDTKRLALKATAYSLLP